LIEAPEIDGAVVSSGGVGVVKVRSSPVAVP
jgi:hypothetical protein